MTNYELMYIIDSSREEGFDEVKQKIESIIAGSEGTVTSFEKIGKKRLAYPIAKRQYGTYFLANFSSNGSVVQAIDYYLRLHQNALRHIILAFSEKQLRLRDQTIKIQLEEAERMRLGGKPFPITETEIVNVAVDAAEEPVETSEVEKSSAVEAVAQEPEDAAVDTAPAAGGDDTEDDNGKHEAPDDTVQEALGEPSEEQTINDKTVD